MTEYRKQDKIIPVVFAIDSNCAAILHVAIRSIIDHATPGHQYQFHILYESLTEAYLESFQNLQGDNFNVQLHNVSRKIKRYAKIMHYKYYGSKAIYYRVFIPEMFPQYDKVIYLDADVVVNADIAELYAYDLGDNYVGGVPCGIINTPMLINYARRFLGLNSKQPSYFNSGVLLMNCAQMRQINFIDQFFDVASNFKLEVCPDQDYYNLLCFGKTLILPWYWNKMPIPGSKQTLDEIKLVHFNVFGKPWRQYNVLYETLFWKHAKNTSMYQTLLQMRDEYQAKFGDDKRIGTLIDIAKELATHDENILMAIQKHQSESRIPKKLHYIWLGNKPLSQKYLDCIKTWRLHCPDYEIVRWDESNFDLDKSPMLRKALADQNYNLASAIMRTFILNEQGGIYLDPDIRILKSLDRFLQHHFFIGYEKRSRIGTAIIGCVPGHPIVQTLAQLCASRRSLKLTHRRAKHMWSAVIATRYQLKINGKMRLMDNGTAIYSKQWFYPIRTFTHKMNILPNTYTIHYHVTERDKRQHLRNHLKAFAWVLDLPFYYLWCKIQGINTRYRVQNLIKAVEREQRKLK